MMINDLFEVKEKNLIGLTIEGKKITEKTPSETWSGHFGCSVNKLTSLEGAPSSVGGDFYSYKNNLTTLEGAPSSVGGNFSCYNNQLTSLEGAPSSVGGYFNCSVNHLISLEGAPSSVGGYFYCDNNKLTSLADIHKRLKKMNGIFYANYNPIKSNVIGLMLVAGCNEVQLDNKEVEKIMNKHLPNTKGHLGLLECQEDLLSAGFEEWAEL